MINKGKDEWNRLLLYKSIKGCIKTFKKDPALAAYWNYTTSEIDLLSETLDIRDIIETLKRKEAVIPNHTKVYKDFFLIILQKEGGLPYSLDYNPLASCIGYNVNAFVIVVKKICWRCHIPLENPIPCKECRLESCCAKQSCTSVGEGYCFINNKYIL